ncbi:hypothetical protein RYH73_06185 [Olivibacter sp. CPCC 100613]|uniref:hypothetical protein n=1 Tax=Olivibacter sp. CPCC 100613 TaxID=3079931 RepID=UPI002FF8D477
MKRLQSLSYVFVNFILTRMVPLSVLSPLMNLLTLIMLGSGLINKRHSGSKITIFAINVTFLTIALLFSIGFERNQPVNAIRSYLLLVIVLFAYFITVSRTALKWFVYFNVFQACAILIASLSMTYLFNLETYLPVRFFVQGREWGDVYTYNGYFFIIQIKGNALLLFTLMIMISPFGRQFYFKYYKLMVVLLFAGVFVAGNFAYLIVLFLYLLLWYIRKLPVRLNIKLVGLLLLLLISAYPIVRYVGNTVEAKKSSLGTRGDQLQVLSRDLNENVFTLLLGKGLGNTVSVVTKMRDYTDQVYYELQAFYMLNQLGFIMFSLYIMSHVLLAYLNFRGSLWIIIIYLGYIVYASTNPYILDTNQFIVIITLNSLVSLPLLEKEKSLRKLVGKENEK